MSIPTVTKQPSESRLFSMDFAALLARGETVASVNSAVVDLTTVPPLVIGTITFSGSVVQMRITGGLTNTLYKVTVVVTTSVPNTLEGEGLIQVEDL